jgi:hypothetical protein
METSDMSEKRYAMFNMNDVIATATFIVDNNPAAKKNDWTVEYMTSRIVDAMKNIVKSQGTPDEIWFLGSAGYFVFLDDYDSNTGYFTVAHQPRFTDSYDNDMIMKIEF